MRAVLPDRSLAPLRRMAEAGLTHSVLLETAVETQNAGGQIATTWVTEPPQPGRLNPLGLNSPLRADQPSAGGRWQLAIQSPNPIYPGQRALASGTTNGAAWQRLVSVDEVLFPRTHELTRRALCTDVVANPA